MICFKTFKPGIVIPCGFVHNGMKIPFLDNALAIVIFAGNGTMKIECVLGEAISGTVPSQHCSSYCMRVVDIATGLLLPLTLSCFPT